MQDLVYDPWNTGGPSLCDPRRANCTRQHARRAGQITGISWQMIPRVLQ